MSTPHQDTGPVKKKMTVPNPRTGEDIEVEVPVYTRLDPEGTPFEYVHPEHLNVAIINADIQQNHIRWMKCANCGEPYQITEEWSGGTVCSDDCDAEFRASLGF
jgi:hypothetical protein